MTYFINYTLVYIDDIIIFSESIDTHIEHLNQVFQRLDKHKLRLNPAKCEFVSNKITYLGHVISADGVKPDPDKYVSVENFPIPKKVKDVRAFLGLTSYYRKFIENYARIASPINKLLKKEHPFDWNKECQESFDLLKEKLIKAPILGHFKPELPIILATDACDYAIAAILSQIQNDREIVISYNSKSLSDRQKVYSTCEKEMFGYCLGSREA